MLTTTGDQAKKSAILDILENKPELHHDKKYGFAANDAGIMYYLNTDPEFYLQFLRIMKAQANFSDREYFKIAYVHRVELLNNPKYKDCRSDVMDILRNYLQGGRNLDLRHSLLKTYVFKPTNTQLLKYEEANIFDKENGHLEYFPIVNQRVFSIGGQE